MSKRKTNDEFIEQMKIINKDIEILTEYHSAKEKVECRCLIDNHKWWATPTNLLSGKGCPVCGGSLQKDNETFKKELFQVNKNIIPLTEYVSSHKKIKCKCLIDGTEWWATPNNLLRGKGCPVCGGLKRMTHDEFVEKMNEINPDIEILGIHTCVGNKIKVRCKKCGHVWTARESHLLEGHGCPCCISSLGEKKIEEFLKAHEINFVSQKKFEGCKNIHRLPFDFYIESINTCIEYDGKQHYEPIPYFGGEEGFKKTKLRDSIKTKFCKDNNINLVRIPYFEYDNIETILTLLLAT